MIKQFIRKYAFRLYDTKYKNIRKKNVQKSLDVKKKLGFLKNYQNNTIPIQELENTFKQAGILPTDTVFLRISLAVANSFVGEVDGFLNFLKEYFKDGNVVMSSYTFNKSPLMYLFENPIFNPNTSIDRLNLVSEMFRRDKEVYRSIHPTHSLIAYGKDAKYIVKDHEKSPFCYHKDSPFAKLYRLNAKEVSIGVYPTSLTYHYIEQFIDKKFIFKDLEYPIMCRLKLNNSIIKKPFYVTDTFRDLNASYTVFKGSEAEAKKFLIQDTIDLHILDLNRQLKAMLELYEQKKYWEITNSKIKDFILQHIVKKIVLYTFFDLKDGILYPASKNKTKGK